MAGSIPDAVARDIHARLDAAEREHEVRVVHACESGSRAWGFASPDSDYDVRFLYVRRPEWYLSFDVERRRDVIEYPIVDEIDIGGWDVSARHADGFSGHGRPEADAEGEVREALNALFRRTIERAWAE